MKENTKQVYKACEKAYHGVYNNKWSDKTKEERKQSKDAHIQNIKAIKAETQAGKKRQAMTIALIEKHYNRLENYVYNKA